jgi:hypothetical protein
VETLDFFSLQRARAFEQIGHEVYLFDLLKEEESLQKLLYQN